SCTYCGIWGIDFGPCLGSPSIFTLFTGFGESPGYIDIFNAASDGTLTTDSSDPFAPGGPLSEEFNAYALATNNVLVSSNPLLFVSSQNSIYQPAQSVISFSATGTSLSAPFPTYPIYPAGMATDPPGSFLYVAGTGSGGN